MDGNLIMCDKFGAVWKARPNKFAEGGYALEQRPIVQLSPGRPLGFRIDSNGDLLVCQAGLVGPLFEHFLNMSCPSSSPLPPLVMGDKGQGTLWRPRFPLEGKVPCKYL